MVIDPYKGMNTPNVSVSGSGSGMLVATLTCMLTLHLTLQMDPLSISKCQPKNLPLTLPLDVFTA